jgi:hypothetical protein
MLSRFEALDMAAPGELQNAAAPGASQEARDEALVALRALTERELMDDTDCLLTQRAMQYLVRHASLHKAGGPSLAPFTSLSVS